MQRAISSYSRQYLLSDAARPIFGRVKRTQVLTLVVLTGYLTIWSFVGIVYGKWVTPVKKMPGVYNTRTSLGAWADRVGVIAYALTPLSIMLSSRESILSLITGLPYQSFNFLHRWLGYIIFAQSTLHTIGWCIIEMRLYQPQPTVAIEWIRQPYMIWGVVAMFILTLLVILSTPWGIRMTGYEFFRKMHYVLAMLYIGACWGHWEQLKCFMLPSLIVWFLDRAIRLARTALLHYNFLSSTEGGMGFRPANADVSFFPDETNGDVVRLDFQHPHDAWNVGQHFYLCFPESSLWQSHPFTPTSLPIYNADTQKHTYVFRAKKGETRKIAELCARRAARTPTVEKHDHESNGTGRSDAKLSVILTGPYGESTTKCLDAKTNVLCIAGGTGITYVLPVLLDIAARPQSSERRMALVWVVRHKGDVEWVAPEIAELRKKARVLGLKIHIYVTRAIEEGHGSAVPVTLPSHSETTTTCKSKEDMDITFASASNTSSSSSSSNHSSPSSSVCLHGTTKSDLGHTHIQNRPDLRALVTEFVEQNVSGGTQVFASGPGEMISELRSVVAGVNRGAAVWKGEEKWDVGLVSDDRLEW